MCIKKILLISVLLLISSKAIAASQTEYEKLRIENKNLKDKLHWVSATCNAYESDLKLINNLSNNENVFNRNSSLNVLQIIQTSQANKYPPHMNCSEY